MVTQELWWCRTEAGGGNVVDGSQEFIYSVWEDDTTPTRNAACGCHRSFHLRLVNEPRP